MLVSMHIYYLSSSNFNHNSLRIILASRTSLVTIFFNATNTSRCSVST
jgi:hypothetical protein